MRSVAGGATGGIAECTTAPRVRNTAPAARAPPQYGVVMLDFAMIAGVVGFFVAAALYVVACERM
jgi:hypothetical protein